VTVITLYVYGVVSLSFMMTMYGLDNAAEPFFKARFRRHVIRLAIGRSTVWNWVILCDRKRSLIGLQTNHEAPTNNRRKTSKPPRHRI